MREIAFENGRISTFQGLVTLTLDWVILHTAKHHSSTSTYIPNFSEIEETFCGQTDVRTDIWVPVIRSTQPNEKGDKAAKSAVNKLILWIPIPYTDIMSIKTIINKYMNNKWQQAWNWLTQNKLYQIYPTIPS